MLKVTECKEGNCQSCGKAFCLYAMKVYKHSSTVNVTRLCAQCLRLLSKEIDKNIAQQRIKVTLVTELGQEQSTREQHMPWHTLAAYEATIKSLIKETGAKAGRSIRATLYLNDRVYKKLSYEHPPTT